MVYTGGVEGSPVTKPIRTGAWNIFEVSRLYLPLNHLQIVYVFQEIFMDLFIGIHIFIYIALDFFEKFFPKSQ